MGRSAEGMPAAGAAPLTERLGADFFGKVPAGPGVYLMLGSDDVLLYVGKAKNLRTRLRSYARLRPGDDQRLLHMINQVVAIRWEEHPSEAHAIDRETELLRGLRPPFNVTHAAPSEHLAIALVDRGTKTRVRLASGPDHVVEIMYAYPFAASTPDAFRALIRLLVLAQPIGPGRRAGMRLTMPASVTKSTGTEVVLVEEVRRSLHSFLSGASSRLLGQLDSIIGERAASDAVVSRAVAKDLATLRSFFKVGPAAVRRLQRQHGGPPGPTSAQELGRLIAADIESQVGAVVAIDRESIEARISSLRQQRLGFGAIAARLNSERVPRVRGGGDWRAIDVAEVVAVQITSATRAAP